MLRYNVTLSVLSAFVLRTVLFVASPLMLDLARDNQNLSMFVLRQYPCETSDVVQACIADIASGNELQQTSRTLTLPETEKLSIRNVHGLLSELEFRVASTVNR